MYDIDIVVSTGSGRSRPDPPASATVFVRDHSVSYQVWNRAEWLCVCMCVCVHVCVCACVCVCVCVCAKGGPLHTEVHPIAPRSLEVMWPRIEIDQNLCRAKRILPQQPLVPRLEVVERRCVAKASKHLEVDCPSHVGVEPSEKNVA